MAALKRFPFNTSAVAFMDGCCVVALHHQDPEEGEGISAEHGAFFHLHGACAACGAPISRTLGPCGCGKYQGETLVLVARFPRDFFYSKYKAILNREKSRSAVRYRKQCIEDNGGTFTKDDIAKLFELQRGLCYYCGCSLGESFQSARYDVDHYQSIYQGGQNDIYNLVLACPTCNRTKNHGDGDTFSRKMCRRRSPELAEVLRQVRKELKAYLKRRRQQEGDS